MAHSTHEIPGGDAGVLATLALMQSVVDDAVNSADVVQFARHLAVRAGVRREYAQAQAIAGWLSRVWRFVHDPADREMLSTPELMLDEFGTWGIVTGDCDDAAILGAALGKAVGLNAQFTVYGFPSDVPGEADVYGHVFAVLLTSDGKRVSLDCTRPRGPVPAPTRILTVDV